MMMAMANEDSSLTIIFTNLGLTDHQGIIINENDDVCFEGRDTFQCRLKHSITFAALKERLLRKVKLEGDEHEIVSIIYRKPGWVNGGVHWSAMDVRNDDDVQTMMTTHVMFRRKGYLHLYVETRRTVAEILRRFTPPTQ